MFSFVIGSRTIFLHEDRNRVIDAMIDCVVAIGPNAVATTGYRIYDSSDVEVCFIEQVHLTFEGDSVSLVDVQFFDGSTRRYLPHAYRPMASRQL